MKRFHSAMGLVLGVMLAGAEVRGQTFKVDPVHSTVLFRIKHVNAGPFWGRFNQPGGVVNWDASDPSKSSFEVTVPTKNVDTANAKRDSDLAGPDFFNSKQFSEMTFKSTSIKKTGDSTFDLAGDLTVKGVTKPITATLEHFGTGEMRGQKRVGFEATFTIKR